MYIGVLEKFGYTLITAGRTSDEAEATIKKEYADACVQRNSEPKDISDEIRTFEVLYADGITIRTNYPSVRYETLKSGKVLWC